MEEDRLATNLGPLAEDMQPDPIPSAKKPKRRFVGLKTAEQLEPSSSNVESSGTASVEISRPRRPARALNTVPADILNDKDIKAAINLLPPNYAFEIPKTIHRIRTSGAKRIALQFPEGLLLFATTISDILVRFCDGVETLIMGDVTYGACCVDDFTARALGCDMLVHYAHSCLIPVSVTTIKTLYVFVDIGIDIQHLVATVEKNFVPEKSIALVGTIQFNSTIHRVAQILRIAGYSIQIPQIAPLSKGEVLGCTSPKIELKSDVATGADILLYLGDGRFHLESAMIHNPQLPAYRYDPYSRRLTNEGYDHTELYHLRRASILKARKAKKWGLILGTLGRQGNPHTHRQIEEQCKKKGLEIIRVALSEIFPGKLAMMGDVDAWVQVACPRLSIDWGYAFPKPLLSPYEAAIALGNHDEAWMSGDVSTGTSYPMDYYAREGLGRVSAAPLTPHTH